MQSNQHHFDNKAELPLIFALIFAFGCAFFISFADGFLEYSTLILTVSLSGVFLGFYNRDSWQFVLFTGISIFFIGCFYAFFYEKTFIKPHEIHSKIYGQINGKIIEIKTFHNPANNKTGTKFLLKNVTISKVENKEKTAKKKQKKKRRISQKYIERNFANISDFQNLDYNSKSPSNLYNIDFESEEKPLNLHQISLNSYEKTEQFLIGDKISTKAILYPPSTAEFPQSFNFKNYAKSKRIFAYGFASGKIEIVEKSENSNSGNFIQNLRQFIKNKIYENITGDEAAIIATFLIGQRDQINEKTLQNIRNSGLAHLLSISGLHLASAGLIIFITLRFLLSRNEYLTLNFDLKKIAAIAAIPIIFFYLKLVNSPIPAQRAFIMILLFTAALMINEKSNSRRILITAFVILLLLNPYNVLSLSFQLSIIAILVLIALKENQEKIYVPSNDWIFYRIFDYFKKIFITSLAIQTATFPFLLQAFGYAATAGFIANLLAIPLVVFLILPLSFLSLFAILIECGVEKYLLILTTKFISFLILIAQKTAAFDFTIIKLDKIPQYGLAITSIGLILVCCHNKLLKITGLTLFLFTFLAPIFLPTPRIIFDSKQKFFAIYDKKDGLFFSEKLRKSKQRTYWMEYFDEKKFKTFDDLPQNLRQELQLKCDKKKCEMRNNAENVLILLKRSKINEICQENYDLVVNLTKRYQIPDCFNKKSAKLIKNEDFDGEKAKLIF